MAKRVLIEELVRGLELAKQLQIYLHHHPYSSSSNETGDLLIQRIISTFENALQMLLHPTTVTQSSQQQHGLLPIGIMSDSPPLSGGGSPCSEDSDRGSKDHSPASKKRNTGARWTKQIRVTPGMGVEGPLDDGFSWRKYGQKDILGATYPRGYYRCTHRNVQGCLATKQVQRSDEDPTVFEITYRGIHTCTVSSNVLVLPPSPTSISLNRESNLDTNPHNNNNNNVVESSSSNLQVNELLLNLPESLKVQTENLDSFSPFCFQSQTKFDFPETIFAENNFNSPSFYQESPATATSSGGISHHVFPGGGHPNLVTSSQISDMIIPAATSAADSPTIGLDLEFPFDDKFQFDGHNFTFDSTRFF